MDLPDTLPEDDSEPPQLAMVAEDVVRRVEEEVRDGHAVVNECGGEPEPVLLEGVVNLHPVDLRPILTERRETLLAGGVFPPHDYASSPLQAPSSFSRASAIS